MKLRELAQLVVVSAMAVVQATCVGYLIGAHRWQWQHALYVAASFFIASMVAWSWFNYGRAVVMRAANDAATSVSKVAGPQGVSCPAGHGPLVRVRSAVYDDARVTVTTFGCPSCEVQCEKTDVQWKGADE